MSGHPLFDLTGKVAVVNGGSGVLGSAIAQGLHDAGACVVVTGSTSEKVKRVAESLAHVECKAAAFTMNALDLDSVRDTCASIADEFQHIDILVNAIGGNRPEATVPPGESFFDLDTQALRDVVELNLFGGVIVPCQEFGRVMAKNPNGGSIINISSMAAAIPLTRVVGYSASKAAVDNFTKWLAVQFAQEIGAGLRVNAIAPGFFLTDQNRFLLTQKDGALTERGQQIVDHTPMGSFGNPEDLVGAAVWLASGASKFVTGIVVPVDGGFSAYSGV